MTDTVENPEQNVSPSQQPVTNEQPHVTININTPKTSAPITTQLPQDTQVQAPIEVFQSETPLPSNPEKEVEHLQEELQEEEKTNAWTNPLLIGLSICAFFVIAAIVWLLFTNKSKIIQIPQFVTQVITPTPQPPEIATTMTGTINFDGYAPSGSYFAISEKASIESSFKDVVSGIVPQSGLIPWTWTDAIQGTNYQIKARLKVQGKTVQESETVSVSAPATSVGLTLTSNQQPPQPQQTTVTGAVHIDGYIPSGATIAVLAKQTANSNYATIISGTPAQDGVQWQWPNAVVGQTYNIEVQLLDGLGNLISANSQKTITAPAAGLLFYVSSTTQPQAPTTTGISGIININGSIPSNSYITLGTRTSAGTVPFNQVISNISASNGVVWTWGAAQSGNQYDVQAYLWVNGQPYAQSNIITVTAPSKNNTLSINAQQQMAAPAGNTLSVTCNGQQNNAYQATINYNTQTNLTNPYSYNIVVTLPSQGSQVMNTTVTPGNPTQSQSLTTTYIFTPGTTYYAQYAYSASPNTSTFSPLSPAIQFSCN